MTPAVTRIAARPFCIKFLFERFSLARFGKKMVKIIPKMNTNNVDVEAMAETKTIGAKSEANLTPKPPTRFNSSFTPFVASIGTVFVFNNVLNWL